MSSRTIPAAVHLPRVALDPPLDESLHPWNLRADMERRGFARIPAGSLDRHDKDGSVVRLTIGDEQLRDMLIALGERAWICATEVGQSLEGDDLTSEGAVSELWVDPPMHLVLGALFLGMPWHVVRYTMRAADFTGEKLVHDALRACVERFRDPEKADALMAVGAVLHGAGFPSFTSSRVVLADVREAAFADLWRWIASLPGPSIPPVLLDAP